MEKLFKQVGDEVTEFTAEEYAQRAKDVAEAKALAVEKAKAEEENAIAKAAAEAKLTALGLTIDDLKALGLGNN
jgi:predicted esterase YcpF (UPF0227 family)